MATPRAVRLRRWPPSVEHLQLAFFVLYTGFALIVLLLGVVSALASVSSGLHETLHRWALDGDGVVARTAQGMADASHRTQPAGQLAIDYGFSLFNLALAGFLVWLRPRDRTALLLAVAMVGTGAIFNLQAYGVYQALPRTSLDRVLHNGFQLTAAVSYIFALLLFPDGRLVPRWPRWALLAVYGPAIGLVSALAFRVETTSRTVALIMYFGLLAPVAGVAGQAYRYRRSATEAERQQARLLFWALTPALLLGLFILSRQVRATAFHAFEGRPIDVAPSGLFRVFQPVFALIPVALFLGILRYRLWNIERVISRALLYGILAGFGSAVYFGVVVGVAGLIGSQGRNLWLSGLATGIVALAFHPVKHKADHLANRLVYGKRATPYEVLSELSEKMASTVAAEDVLPQMAFMIAQATAAPKAGVWLVLGGELRPGGWWPEGDARPDPVPLSGGELPAIPGVTFAVAVRHQGELLGALTVTKRGGEGLLPTEERLLADVGAQAGLMLRNARLTAELVARLEELRASRQRLVAAQDKERRRIERDLHDGAQQQLVALNVLLGLSEKLAQRGEPVTDLLAQMKAQAAEAVENLRDLARGIYPPLLAAEGLPAALAAQQRRVPFTLEVDADGIGRYPQPIEAAVYFCCLEAFQNASKHAEASRVRVTLREADGKLAFRVADNGRGFDPAASGRGSGTQNMADRIDALDGVLDITSEVGVGTTVSGWIPLAHAGSGAGGGDDGRAVAPVDEPVGDSGVSPEPVTTRPT